MDNENQHIRMIKERIAHSIELQDAFLSIDSISVEEVKKIILQNQFYLTKEGNNRLLNQLQSAVRARPVFLHRYSELINSLSSFFSCFSQPLKILELFGNNSSILMTFYNSGAFCVKDIIYFSLINANQLVIFYKEIQEALLSHDLNISLTTYEKAILEERMTYLDIEDIKKVERLSKDENNLYRIEGHCEAEISKIIRYDDVQKLEKYIDDSIKSFSYHQKIPYSLYEADYFINNKNRMPEIIEYAAFWGSVNIFRLLFGKIRKIPMRIMEYAVSGGNMEIVKFLDDHGIVFSDGCIHCAIEYQRRKMVEFLIKEKHFEISLFTKMLCFQTMNLTGFFEIIDENDFINETSRRHIAKVASSYGLKEIY